MSKGLPFINIRLSSLPTPPTPIHTHLPSPHPQARVHPEDVAAELGPSAVSRLHAALSYVLTTAVALDADSDLFPDSFLFKHRWSKGKKEASKFEGHAIRCGA